MVNFRLSSSWNKRDLLYIIFIFAFLSIIQIWLFHQRSVYMVDCDLNFYNSFLLTKGKLPFVDHPMREFVARFIPAFFIEIFGLNMQSGYYASTFTTFITIFGVFIFSYKLFNKKTAYLSLIMYGFSLSVLKMGFKITQVTYFHLFFVLLLFTFWQAINNQSLKLFGLAGVLLGLLSHSYRLGALLLVSIPLIIVLYTDSGIRKGLSFFFGAFLSYLLPLLTFSIVTNPARIYSYGWNLLGLFAIGAFLFLLLSILKKRKSMKSFLNLKFIAFLSFPVLIYLFITSRIPLDRLLFRISTMASHMPHIILGIILIYFLAMKKIDKVKIGKISFLSFLIPILLISYGYFLPMPFPWAEGFRWLFNLSLFVFSSFFLFWILTRKKKGFHAELNQSFSKEHGFLFLIILPFLAFHFGFHGSIHLEYVMYYTVPGIVLLTHLVEKEFSWSNKIFSLKNIAIGGVIILLLSCNAYAVLNSTNPANTSEHTVSEVTEIIRKNTAPKAEILSRPLYAIESGRLLFENIARIQYYNRVSALSYYPPIENLIRKIEERKIKLVVFDKNRPTVKRLINLYPSFKNYIENKYETYKETEEYKVLIRR